MTDNNPIEAARASVPWWMEEVPHLYALAVFAVRDISQRLRDGGMPLAEDETWIERCAPEAAELWSVYGYGPEGCVLCLEDFETEARARAFAAELLETYPNLRKFGLLD